ncbi:MAG: hypothetical protein ACP5U1_08530 [Desulfomonilaceae bacterium]
MNSQLIISLVIVVFAVSSFFFLAQTLWSIWLSKGWMENSDTSDKGSEHSGGLQRAEWKESACYKYCMGKSYSGVGSPYRHCATICGLK